MERMNFKEFLILMEMPRMRNDEKLWFDDLDTKYLAQFPKTFWGRALAYRYSPNVLQNPDPEIRNITLDIGRGPVTFDNIKVYGYHLIDKLQRMGYDPSTYQPSRGAIQNVGRMLTAGKQGSFSIRKDEPKGYERPAVHNVKMSGTFTLDQHDKKYLNSFRQQPRLMGKALAKRYSAELLNDPNDFQNITLIEPGGKKAIFNNVPVFPQVLKQKLDNLKERGVDFYSRPMDSQQARRILKNNVYDPGHHVPDMTVNQTQRTLDATNSTLPPVIHPDRPSPNPLDKMKSLRSPKLPR